MYLNNYLTKLIKRVLGFILLVIIINFIKVDNNLVWAKEDNSIRKESVIINTSNIPKVDENFKSSFSEPSAKLAKGKVIIKITSVDSSDNTLTVKAEIENNSEYVVGKSLYNFLLVDSNKKRIQLNPVDNYNFCNDIEPNSIQNFQLIFTNVDLNAKPMMLKGQLFIPDPGIRDDRFNLELVY